MEHAGKKIDDEELAAAMKGKGLGTPATRAETIEKLITREFIGRGKGGSLRATAHGIKMIDILEGFSRMDYICGINWRYGSKVGRSSTWYKPKGCIHV